jgi:hypothetical protein
MSAVDARADAPRFAERALHLVVLWNFGVSQPLLLVLGNSPEFFIASRLTPTEIVGLALASCFLAPAILVAVLAVTHRVSPRLAWRLHLLLLALGTAAVVLVAARRLLDPPPAVSIGAAVLVGISVAVAYTRRPSAAVLFTVLSPALVVVPLSFLAGSNVSRVLRPPQTPVQAVETHSTVPVVLLVFDELPLASLLDERMQVDAATFPNFARLAADAHWFRNTTSVAQATFYAIPALVTGRYPDADRLPIAADHPNSLFTLLSSSHDLHVSEAGTRVCPDSLCGTSATRSPSRQRATALGRDLSIVYLHVALPSAMAVLLPPLNEGWNNFGRGAALTGGDSRETLDRGILAAVETDRVQVFESFIAGIAPSPRPGLYSLHSMLTHVPWVYLPSGHRHTENTGTIGLDPLAELWAPDEFLVAQAYQRHLLQVGFADRLLGRTVDRLKQAGVYDSALLAFTIRRWS